MAAEFESRGRVIATAEPGYQQACHVWNERVVTHPREIVYCQNAPEVAAALRSALDRRLPFRLRCGGHSYEGFSMVDGGVIIDVTDVNTVSVNADRTAAVIGGGARLGDVDTGRMRMIEHLIEEKLTPAMFMVTWKALERSRFGPSAIQKPKDLGRI